MRSAYKSPIIWMTVVIGILFAIAGQILTTTIQSDWKYLFYDMKPGGIGIAVFFAFCALANFIGTRFAVDKPFTQHLPSTMVAVVGCFAAISLMIVMFLGIENKFSLVLLFTAAGAIVLAIPTAFFLRGMAVPTVHDR